jgi:hypothetical protein
MQQDRPLEQAGIRLNACPLPRPEFARPAVCLVFLAGSVRTEPISRSRQHGAAGKKGDCSAVVPWATEGKTAKIAFGKNL